MKKIYKYLATSLLCGLLALPVVAVEESSSGVLVQIEEKNNHIQILNLPVLGLALEMTFVFEEKPVEIPEYTPFLSIDTSFFQEQSDICYTLYVASTLNFSDSENFFFGTLDLKGAEILEITSIKVVDFLLNERVFSDIDFELVSEFENLEDESEENTDEETEDESDDELEESDEELDEELLEEDENSDHVEEELSQEKRYEKILAQYTDISDHWAKERILFVIDQGYFSGMSETEFMPNETMTRGMFVTVLGNVDNMDKSQNYESDFVDVADSDWFAPYVGWAVEKGVASGLGDGIFAPNQSVSREQMAVMLLQYINLSGVELVQNTASQSFADHEEISVWALEAVYYMQSRGLLSGKENNLFDPQGQATRGEVATLLKNVVESMESPTFGTG